MRQICLIAGMAAAVLMSTPSTAQSTQSPEKPKERKTCRSLTPTGSFLPTRVCNTDAAWAKFDGVNQSGVSEFRRALNMTSTNEHAQEK